MLIQFSVKNYRSIKDWQTLTLKQDTRISDDIGPLIQNSDGLPNLLRAVAIYGANASGKSNILKALEEMRDFILGSTDLKPEDKIDVMPFLLDSSSKSEPSEFEIEFIADDGVKYCYGYAATKERIHREYLDAYPKKSKQNWYTRQLNKKSNEYEWSFSSYFRGEKETIKTSTRENVLFFSTAVFLNNEMLETLQKFFSKKLILELNTEVSTKHTKSYIKRNKSGKKRVIEFLKRTDTGIDDLQIEHKQLKQEQVDTILSTLPKSISDEQKEEIRHEIMQEELFTIRSLHINPDTKKAEAFPAEYESEGTLKLLSCAGLWLWALEYGQTIVVEELENSLHCSLTGYLIKLFNNPKTNPNNAQLIFTTHSSVALRANELRRDQIWFADKDKSTLSTSFYPLSRAKKDGSVPRNNENWLNQYLKGSYSAVPKIDPQYMLDVD